MSPSGAEPGSERGDDQTISPLTTILSLRGERKYFAVTKESIIEKTYSSENLPLPLSFDKLRMVSVVEPFSKEGLYSSL